MAGAGDDRIVSGDGTGDRGASAGIFGRAVAAVDGDGAAGAAVRIWSGGIFAAASAAGGAGRADARVGGAGSGGRDGGADCVLSLSAVRSGGGGAGGGGERGHAAEATVSAAPVRGADSTGAMVLAPTGVAVDG